MKSGDAASMRSSRDLQEVAQPVTEGCGTPLSPVTFLGSNIEEANPQRSVSSVLHDTQSSSRVMEPSNSNSNGVAHANEIGAQRNSSRGLDSSSYGTREGGVGRNGSASSRCDTDGTLLIAAANGPGGNNFNEEWRGGPAGKSGMGPAGADSESAGGGGAGRLGSRIIKDQYNAVSDESDDDDVSDEADAAHDEEDQPLFKLNNTALSTLKRLRHNDPSLSALDLSNMVFRNKFWHEFSQEMKHNSHLKQLYLNNCRLTDHVLVKVLVEGYCTKGSASQLEVLSLEDNFIQNIGCKYVAIAMSRGTKSKFERHHAGGLSLNHGLRKGGLVAVSLRGNRIRGADGVRHLVEALIERDTSLQVLNLAKNMIDPRGAGFLGLALRNTNILRSLDLRSNPISSHGCHELQLACQAAEANLIMAEEQEHLVRVCGKRNVVVYVDGTFDDEAVFGGRLSEDVSRPLLVGEKNEVARLTEQCGPIQFQTEFSGTQTASRMIAGVAETVLDSEDVMSDVMLALPGVPRRGNQHGSPNPRREGFHRGQQSNSDNENVGSNTNDLNNVNSDGTVSSTAANNMVAAAATGGFVGNGPQDKYAAVGGVTTFGRAPNQYTADELLGTVFATGGERQRPLCRMKRNAALECFEPAGLMVEQDCDAVLARECGQKVKRCANNSSATGGKNSQRSSTMGSRSRSMGNITTTSSSFRPAFSAIDNQYCRHGEEKLINETVARSRVDPNLMSAQEKELCTSFSSSRFKFKPGTGYYFLPRQEFD